MNVKSIYTASYILQEHIFLIDLSLPPLPSSNSRTNYFPHPLNYYLVIYYDIFRN